MATTFTLKRKYFADPNQQGNQKKGTSTGKKLAIGGTVATLGAAALATRGAGGVGKLATSVGNAFKSAGGGIKGVTAATKNVGTNIVGGAKALPGDIKNVGGKVVEKAKNVFSKTTTA